MNQDKMEIVKDYNVLATEINVIKAQTNKILLASAIEIGKRLEAAKKLVGHGNWGTWLETEVSYSSKTASNLIRIYKEYGEKTGEIEIGKQYSDLGFSQAIALLQLDFNDRESFIEMHDPNQMSVREFEEAIREKKIIEEEKADLEKRLSELEDKDSEHAETLKTKIRQITEYEEMLREKNQDIKELKALLEEKDTNEEADPEVIDMLQEDIKAKEADIKAKATEIKELKKKLKEKPKEIQVEVEKEVEVIPENLQVEMDSLKSELEKTMQKLNSSEGASKFKANFEVLKNVVGNMINTLEEVKAENPEEHTRYKTAFNNMLDKLRID